MRTYKRKTNRGITPKDVLDRACQQVIFDKKSINSTAKEFNIPYKTLQRHVVNVKKKLEKKTELSKSESTLDSVGYRKNRQIFSDEEELALESYLKTAADIYYGLTPYETRKFAYEFAKKNNKSVPASWNTKLIAGKDWLGYFLKRHPALSIRTPQATSLSRATSFNKHNVSLFFDNLKTVYLRHNLSPGDIWNVDETGLTTVHVPTRVIARRGIKNLGKITSAERGALVTVAVAISALGNMVPPFFIFPRVHYKEHFIRGGPVGSDGDTNSSGWMKEDNFRKFAKHFVKYAKPSKENPVLLLLDNHDSHLSIEVLNYFKENGVIILSFPPHCSHKLQPLDRTVYGPLKKYYNQASDNWLASHPGKTITIYDIPELVKISLPLAATIDNIQSGFRVTGISPFNDNIFPESEFSGSYVTNRPAPDVFPALTTASVNDSDAPSHDLSNQRDSCNSPKQDDVVSLGTLIPSTSNVLCEVPSTSDALLVTNADYGFKTPEKNPVTDESMCMPRTSFTLPEDIRPFPKAGLRISENEKALFTQIHLKKKILCNLRQNNDLRR